MVVIRSAFRVSVKAIMHRVSIRVKSHIAAEERDVNRKRKFGD